MPYSTQPKPDPESNTKASNTNPAWSSWPEFDEEQISAATNVLQSGHVNYWTGTQGREFEAEFAKISGCQHAVAVANGTLALELALHAIGIERGDEVIIPPRTFIATASSVVARGATPIFADVDLHTQNITAASIAEQITSRTKAIIVVHLAGWPCDMDPIMELAKHHGLAVIEDCAQAHGARYKGRPVGSLGDVAAFSFCQDKIMTTAGEGGMLVTNSESLWRRAWSYKDHGKSYRAVFEQEHPPGFRWLHESFGTNMRMTEVQSAVGRVALRRLPAWVETRRRNAATLTERLSELDILKIPVPPTDIYHSYYKFYTFLVPQFLRPDWNRERIIAGLSAKGIPCYSGSCSEIYLEKAFPNHMRPTERLPRACQLGETGLMFQIDPTISEKQINLIAETLTQILQAASITFDNQTPSPQVA